MSNKNMIIVFAVLGVCLILVGTTAQHIFQYAPLVGWIGGLVFLLIATFLVSKRTINHSRKN
ncbi:hypothetical protein PaeCFBP13512_04405 [Paenibacillus sp. CFBP13512]|uniref:hypothetical protein n=1 Tax=Paenibacillus sp. CFBP13512 TaxID=2184007 RepID=UPI0010C0EC9B|nr:hypothetical protein [Paenibacillus sp. CFBP13512]TKJ93630.1 hypothetical protein PaeCFBP13512_04405 [Paenibacillus sp. CFBP13512]